MQTQHIALVPEVAGINASELARVSAALQKQVIRDLSPIWQVSATVDAFPHLEDVPVGYWPIILAFGELGSDEGVHCDRRGQPYALIEMSPSWSLTASHACIEMLIDPYGNRTVVGPSPRSDQGSVEFLVDICDPCEDARYGYTVNDVLVSDFCTPEFLAQIPSGKERYSFTGAVEAPYQVLPGGRLSWYEPASNRWWQRNHFGGAARDTDLGFIEKRSGRGFSVNHPRAPKHLHATKMTLEAFESRMGVQRQRALHASQSQAHLLRVHLGNPGGVGELALDANAPTMGGLAARSGLSDRPQVLAALIKASVGAANGADAASVRRRALAEALASNEERAVVGAQVRAVGERTQVSAAATPPDPTFEAIEDTVAVGAAMGAPVQPTAPIVSAPPNDGRRTTGGSVAAEQKRLEMERRAQTARASQAWAAQRPKDGRRTTIPPPMPRTMPGPPPVNPRSFGNTVRSTGSPARMSVGAGAGRITGKAAAASIAPTAINVGSTPPRPSSSIRDRLLLAAAVGAASLAAVALYGSTGAPTNATAPAASAAASAPAPAPSATPAAVASAAPAPAEVRSADVPAAAKPTDAVPPASAVAARPAPRAARGPRPKVATGAAAKGDPNPYDPPGVEPIERLVEERR
jgi:hypothetical protein